MDLNPILNFDELEEIEETLNLFRRYFFEEYYRSNKNLSTEKLIDKFKITKNIYLKYNYFVLYIEYAMLNRDTNKIYFNKIGINADRIDEYNFLCLLVSRKLNRLFIPQTHQINTKVYVYGMFV